MKKTCNIIIVFLVILLCINITTIITEHYKKRSRLEIKEIPELRVTKDTNKFKDIREHYNNDDIVGKITIENLEISEFVVQSDDNDFYLTHNLFKEYDKFGNVFLDYRNDINTSKQINIYGHNFYNYDVEFSRLDEYLSVDYYQNNKYIYIETDADTYKYEIFSVYGIFRSDNEHMKLEFSTFEEWDEHFKKMKSKSIYDTGVLVDGNNNVLTLQTCLYNYPKGNYLIINAKQI